MKRLQAFAGKLEGRGMIIEDETIHLAVYKCINLSARGSIRECDDT